MVSPKNGIKQFIPQGPSTQASECGWEVERPLFLLSDNSLPNFILIFGVILNNFNNFGLLEVIFLTNSHHDLRTRLYSKWNSLLGTTAPLGVIFVLLVLALSIFFINKESFWTNCKFKAFDIYNLILNLNDSKKFFSIA